MCSNMAEFLTHPSSHVHVCHQYLQVQMKRIKSRTAEKEAYSPVGGQIWLNFKLLQAPMHVIITCKFEKEWMKNSQEKDTFFSHHNPICYRGNQWCDLAEFQAPMYIIIISKYEKDLIKNSREKVETSFFPLHI